MENEKTCADCVHFAQHYVKAHRCYYRKIGGHCCHNRNKKADKLCEHFCLRNREYEKQQDYKTIVDYMSEIAQRMNDIKEILRNEIVTFDAT